MRGILTYHSIDSSRSAISIDEAAFRRHVRWLASGRVRVSALDELLAAPAGADRICLTFDDALENFASRAWPLLRDHGLPVVLFVPTGFVGRSNAWSGSSARGVVAQPVLDWASLARLAEQGVTLGSHSCTHVDMRRLDEAALDDEFSGSARRIEAETGQRPEIFAYPYGGVDRRVAAAAARHYRFGCTTELRLCSAVEKPTLLPRLDAYYFQRPGTLEAWGSTRFRTYLAARAIARKCRSLLLRLPRPGGGDH